MTADESRYFDMVGDVLDHPVVDVNDYACGKVDDLELEGDPGHALRVKALLIGPGAWVPRLPHCFQRMARKAFGDELVSVLWEQVQHVDPKIKLRSTAAALGLGK